MIKLLLRSGYRDDFLARGDSGRKVFDSALQIIETLRLRQQHALLRCLAIPQVNTTNKRIDWYAPEYGEAIPWSSASRQQQQQALHYLENCQKELAILSLKNQASANKTTQLFTALLSQILYFPGTNHIYLINNLPVITFWGFTQPEDIHETDILAQLHTALFPAPQVVAEDIIEDEQDVDVPVDVIPEPELPQPEAPPPPPGQSKQDTFQSEPKVAGIEETRGIAVLRGCKWFYVLLAVAYVCAVIVMVPYISER